MYIYICMYVCMYNKWNVEKIDPKSRHSRNPTLWNFQRTRKQCIHRGVGVWPSIVCCFLPFLSLNNRNSNSLLHMYLLVGFYDGMRLVDLHGRFVTCSESSQTQATSETWTLVAGPRCNPDSNNRSAGRAARRSSDLCWNSCPELKSRGDDQSHTTYAVHGGYTCI